MPRPASACRKPVHPATIWNSSMIWPRAWNVYGRVAFRQGDPDLARASYLESIALNDELGRSGENIWPRVDLAYLFLRQGQFAPARLGFVDSLAPGAEQRKHGRRDLYYGRLGQSGCGGRPDGARRLASLPGLTICAGRMAVIARPMNKPMWTGTFPSCVLTWMKPTCKPPPPPARP